MTSHGMQAERRLPVLCKAVVRVNRHSMNATVRDLSTKGLRLCVPLAEVDHFTKDARVDIVIHLPRTPSPVALAGVVAWSRDATGYRGEDELTVGLTFAGVSEAAAATLERFIVGYFETVLVVDPDPSTRELAHKVLGTFYEVIEAETVARAFQILAETEVSVLIGGSRFPDGEARDLLLGIANRYPGCQAVRMMVVGSEDVQRLEELSRLYRVFYFLRRPVNPQELRDVVRGAVTQYWEAVRPDPQVVLSAKTAAFSLRVLEVTRRLLSQADLRMVGKIAVDALAELLEADRAYYYVYDPISETLRSGGAAEVTATRSAIAGLAGYVARTGAALAVDRADADPRFLQAIDDPDAIGGERFAAAPLLSPDRRTLGVVIAVRNASRPPFDANDQQRLATLATSFSPAFGQVTLQTQIEALFQRERRKEDGDKPFRRAALEAHQGSGYELARPLQLSPRWVWRSYALLIAATVAAVIYLVLGTLAEYASGPAIVRIEGRTDITATEPGIVASVAVQPGQRVTTKQILVRFHDAKEAIELERNRSEFELQLVKSLRNPGDLATRETLARLRTERDFAQARLEARAVLAPHDGIVNDVRIRPGQSLSAGDPILSITGPRAEPSIVAFIPGQFRPMLRAGQRVRLEVQGFRYAYAELELETIGDEVVGPIEARRYLGKEVGDAIQILGPVVLVKARLPSRSFTADGKLYNYHDGMQAVAEVRVRSQRILARLIPALKALPWFSSFWSEALDE